MLFLLFIFCFYIMVVLALRSVQHRWERVVSKSAERTRALDHGYKEAREFHDAWLVLKFKYFTVISMPCASRIIWQDLIDRKCVRRHWIRRVVLFYCAVLVPHMPWMTCHIIYATQYNSVVLSFLASNRQIYLSYGFLQFNWRKIMLYIFHVEHDCMPTKHFGGSKFCDLTLF